MALALVALAFSHQAIIQAELFVPTKFACSYLAPRALGSDSTPIRQLARALVPDGFARNAWMGLGGRPRLSLTVLMARLPRRTLSLDFLAPAFPGELVRVLF